MTIPDPDRIQPSKPAEPFDKPLSSNPTGAGFESYMKGSGNSKTGSPPVPNPGSGIPIGGAGTSPPLSANNPSLNSLLAQASQAQDSLGTVGTQLKNQNLKLKRSQTHLVRQKLGDANTYIRTAGSKLGLELSEGKLPAGVSGIAKFIAMINDGQDQLAQVQAQLKKMSANQDHIDPGEMMSIQVKMGLAQQEIEYTSTLLGKVIQSTTQLMNTQL